MPEDGIRTGSWSEIVRFRPGMYVGGTDSRAMTGLVLQIVKEQAELAAAGLCREIRVHLRENNTVMIDNDGPGYLLLGEQALQVTDWVLLFTGLRVGATSVTVFANALSTDFEAEVRRDGVVAVQSFHQGIAVGSANPLRTFEPGESTGITITFALDSIIFGEAAVSYPDLVAYLREIAFLVPGLRIKTVDERLPDSPTIEFCYENGLVDFVRYLNRDCVPLHEVIAHSYEIEFREVKRPAYTIKIDFAIQFTDCAKPFQLSFADYHETIDGGVPVDELRRGIQDAILQSAQEAGLTVQQRSHTFFRGMTAVIHVRHPYAIYEGCLQNRLVNIDLSVVYPLAYQAILDNHFPTPDFLNRTCTRTLSIKPRRYGVWADQIQFDRNPLLY
ncbi:MAG TPA: hypothetical protein VHP83_17475 [Aggregatilineaceae bacterium]|nr:hypothetical protein [Aggregatilineaceae bacterium]